MTAPTQHRQLEILLVEDNPADAELAVIGLSSSSVQSDIHVVEDGESAIDFLRQQGKFSTARKPDLILLDLNLPGMDGREVLIEIKHDDDLKEIPVVVLTTSSAPPDISAAYRNYANSFMTKPVDFDKFNTMLAGLSEYWFKLVHLPSDIEQ